MVIMARPFKEDKEIEREFEKQRRISGAMRRRYLARPILARSLITRREFEMLREEVERACQIIDEHGAIIVDHEDRIAFLEARLRKIRESDIKAVSDKNVRLLREMFNLPEIKGEVKDNVLAEMQGMLKEYSEEGIDSVELLRSIRDEWR
jgi:hypothetical protein